MTQTRLYRRRSQYPGHLSVSMNGATRETVEKIADQVGWSLAETVRECIEAGLPKVKSRVKRDYHPHHPGRVARLAFHFLAEIPL